MGKSKRLMDVVLSALGLVALLPVMAAVALLVKLEDGGPVFFTHRRIGRNYRPFGVIKFRTMRQGAGGPELTTEGDCRVTRVGRFLRKWKLDELPQLINVLTGRMSLVGPRPEVEKYVGIFREKYDELLKVRPGITDPASIRFRDEEAMLAGAEDLEARYVNEVLPMKLEINLEYARNMSVFRDAVIILRTVGKVLFPGADGGQDPDNGSLLPVSVRQFVARHRRAIVVGFHVAAVAAANYLAFYIRFDGAVPDVYRVTVPFSVALALMVRVPLFYAFGLYNGVWRFTGMSDLRSILVSATLGSAAMHLLFWLWGYDVVRYPHSVVLLDWLLVVAFTAGFRLCVRLYAERGRGGEWDRVTRTLVIGAGEAGERIVRQLKTTSSGHYPIGFIDDDHAKSGLCIHGVPILGKMKDLPAVVQEHRPQQALIAIPSARPDTLRHIVKELSLLGLPVKTLPRLSDILDGRVSVGQIREVELSDLLGRPQVRPDIGRLNGFIKGKRVMVTGAGGSIGSEICRQAAELGAAAVIAYERHENSLYHLDMEFREKRPDAPFFPIIGDVTDGLRLSETLSGFTPDVLFHAAAYKHVPMMEQNPREAICNNVLGTRRTAELAGEYGVGTFVLISTDKAVNPSSVMGASKRACELITRSLHGSSATRYVTVRFGNVMGSSGSVVPLFREQIERGGPVTVTHPDVERYLMMIPEAVQLVMEAATLGKGGEIFVLNMGKPVNITELAKNLIVLSGYVPDKDIGIEYVGLRPGEKLCEELFCKCEEVVLTPHSKVFMAVSWGLPDIRRVKLFGDQLEWCVRKNDTAGMMGLLCGLVETYRPQSLPERVDHAA